MLMDNFCDIVGVNLLGFKGFWWGFYEILFVGWKKKDVMEK